MAVAFLSFFYMSAMVFLLLEAIVIAHRLVVGVVCPIADKILIMVAMGFIVPFLFTIVAVPVLFESLVPNDLKV